MAVVTSNTACAPITVHSTSGSLPELTRDLINIEITHEKKENSSYNNTLITSGSGVGNHGIGGGNESKSHHSSLAERLHGLTEKLHSIGHYRSESDCGSRGRSGTCTLVSDNHKNTQINLCDLFHKLFCKLL